MPGLPFLENGSLRMPGWRAMPGFITAVPCNVTLPLCEHSGTYYGTGAIYRVGVILTCGGVQHCGTPPRPVLWFMLPRSTSFSLRRDVVCWRWFTWYSPRSTFYSTIRRKTLRDAHSAAARANDATFAVLPPPFTRRVKLHATAARTLHGYQPLPTTRLYCCCAWRNTNVRKTARHIRFRTRWRAVPWFSLFWTNAWRQLLVYLLHRRCSSRRKAGGFENLRARAHRLHTLCGLHAASTLARACACGCYIRLAGCLCIAALYVSWAPSGSFLPDVRGRASWLRCYSSLYR